MLNNIIGISCQRDFTFLTYWVWQVNKIFFVKSWEIVYQYFYSQVDRLHDDSIITTCIVHIPPLGIIADLKLWVWISFSQYSQSSLMNAKIVYLHIAMLILIVILQWFEDDWNFISLGTTIFLTALTLNSIIMDMITTHQDSSYNQLCVFYIREYLPGYFHLE